MLARQRRGKQADSSALVAAKAGGVVASPVNSAALGTGLQEVIWSGSYVGTVVRAAGDSLLNAPQYLTGKVLGDAAAAYIKDKLGGKAKVVLLTQDSLEFLTPRFVAIRDAHRECRMSPSSRTSRPILSTRKAAGRPCAPSCSRIRMSMSCWAPIPSCSAPRGVAGGRQGAAEPVSRRH